jgi:hypothetical protein
LAAVNEALEEGLASILSERGRTEAMTASILSEEEELKP